MDSSNIVSPAVQIPITFKPDHISPNEQPEFQTEGSVGVDLPADVNGRVVLDPGERELIPTGLHVALPSNVEAQVRPRSGLALNYGVTVLNTPGTIDQDYRGDVGVILVNFGDNPHSVIQGDRIGQLIFSPVFQPDLLLQDELPPPEDTHEGFGSTGR